MNHLTRPIALKIAAVLAVLMSFLDIFVYQLPDLIRGAAPVNQLADTNGGPPFFLVIIGFVIDIIAIIAAYGAWRGQKWGIVLLIIVAVLIALQSGLAFLGAPDLSTRMVALTGAVVEVLVIGLCLWRERRSALT